MNEGFKVSKLPTENGSESVKDALIEAACEMLAESGPRSMSVRKVAARAEVNHGQVHHYFGGKQGLIEAAMAQMSEEHYENARLRVQEETHCPRRSLLVKIRSTSSLWCVW